MKLPYNIGVFQLCSVNVDVHLIDGTGGTGNPRPTKTARPKLMIGIDQEWWKVFTTVMHEAEEFCLLQFGYSFVPTSTFIHDSTTYIYHFDHGEFCRVNEEVGYFMVHAIPKIQKLHTQYNREKRHAKSS